MVSAIASMASSSPHLFALLIFGLCSYVQLDQTHNNNYLSMMSSIQNNSYVMSTYQNNSSLISITQDNTSMSTAQNNTSMNTTQNNSSMISTTQNIQPFLLGTVNSTERLSTHNKSSLNDTNPVNSTEDKSSQQNDLEHEKTFNRFLKTLSPLMDTPQRFRARMILEEDLPPLPNETSSNNSILLNQLKDNQNMLNIGLLKMITNAENPLNMLKSIYASSKNILVSPLHNLMENVQQLLGMSKFSSSILQLFPWFKADHPLMKTMKTFKSIIDPSSSNLNYISEYLLKLYDMLKEIKDQFPAAKSVFFSVFKYVIHKLPSLVNFLSQMIKDLPSYINSLVLMTEKIPALLKSSMEMLESGKFSTALQPFQFEFKYCFNIAVAALHHVNVLVPILTAQPLLMQPRNFPPLLHSILTVVRYNLQQLSSEPQDVGVIKGEYDFIIVGAGSAGCVLANRLTENPDWKVLLIEAGMEELFMDIPILTNLLQLTPMNWNYKTVPKDEFCLGMENKECNVPRGKVMGGSSAINYMIHTRGNKRDYNQWAEEGNKGWAYKDVKPFFMKSENYRFGRKMNPKYHRRNGPLTVSKVSYRTPIADAFVKAGVQLGRGTVDVNGATQTGFSYLPVTQINGTRASTSRSFLHPIRNRTNLHVTKHSLVTKIHIDENTNTATGVELIKFGMRFQVKARKEVILSAGAINSPQLLLLSGIGPKEHLKEMNIPVIKDLKVGYNLQDHVALGGLTFSINETISFKTKRLLENPMPLESYLKFHKGPLTVPGGVEGIAFFDLNQPNKTDGWPNLELCMQGGMLSSDSTLKKTFGIRDDIYDAAYKATEDIDGFMILPIVMRPKSRGRVYLRDPNPKSPPMIDLNFFAEKEDLDILVLGVRKAQELLKTRAMRQLNAKLFPTIVPGCKHLAFDSDDYWRCHARHLSFTMYHQSGTCKMGPSSDPDAVVDPQLRVLGVQRLRVIDASIMPLVTSGHTNAATIMIAEKGAEMIKQTHKS